MIQNKMEVRKKQIIETAAKIFAESGFKETTISEIAKKTKVSEASIYEYFHTKEGLLFSIPVELASELFEKMEFHLKLIRGAANKLRSIVFLFMNFYQTTPDFASVLMLFLKHDKKFLDTDGHRIIKIGIKHITNVIEDGVKTGEFRKDINPYLVRSMILGTIEHLVTNWIMTGTPENLEEMVDPFIDIIIEGIQDREIEKKHWSMGMFPVKAEDSE